jgi:16S rRNA (guanine966-N2)-methyltransferase
MLRIIAGKHRGRKIETKENSRIRPTSGMARGAIFNILMHGVSGPNGESPLVDGRVVDLFCGTGALGLEALSRGAAHVTFIDQSAESMSLARANAASMGEKETVQFLRSDSTSLPPTTKPCNLAFLDPPYGSGLALKSLASLDRQGWLLPDAVVVVEMDAKEAFTAPEPYTLFDERKYSNTKIAFVRYSKIKSEV